MYHIQLQDQLLSYDVIRSNRKSMAIEVTANGLVIVRVGKMVKKEQWEAVLLKKQDWILNHRKRMLAAVSDKPSPIADGYMVQILGRAYELKLECHKKKEIMIGIEGEKLLLRYPEGMDEVREVIRQWLIEQAKILILERVALYADKMQLSYGRVTIKDQKTRWGSCSSKKNLNFNYRLIMAPLEILDYVVVHELAHLKQMNHSSLFWREVEQVIPDYKTRRNWLNFHQKQLKL